MNPAPVDAALRQWDNAWPLPHGWIPLHPAKDLRDRPAAVEVAGRDFVLWQDREGLAHAALNRCPHMGVRLETGAVDGEGRLRCPLHGWAFGPDGRCQEAPGHPSPPERGLEALPTLHAHGWIFGHLGASPAHPLPAFNTSGLRAMGPITFQADVPWFLIVANGFDVPHFEHVHGRRARRPAMISTPHPDALVVEHEFDLVGRGLHDRFLQTVDGGPVRMRYEVWGGHAIRAEMRFRRITSRLLIFVLPDGPDRSTVQMWSMGASALEALPRRWMTRAFFEHEFREIRGARLRPGSLTPVDEGQATYLEWLADRLLRQNRVE